jgi:hypothetical protein
MSAVPSPIVRLCCDYARMRCDARYFGRMQVLEYQQAAKGMLTSARALYDAAPQEAVSYLDKVRQVLDIDPHEQNAGRVLLRASLLI